MKKYCVKCGKPFDSIGREVICPVCREAAAEETKRAAVLRAKKASWTGESVPVRISGRASTIIRLYGTANNMPFAAALDDLLKSSSFFQTVGKAWEEVEPYKSHRRDKSTATSTTETAQEVKTAGKPQDVPQDVQDEPVKTVQAAKKADKAAGKATAASKAASKAKVSRAAGKE